MANEESSVAVELNLAGQKVKMRISGGKPQIWRRNRWEDVARLKLRCGHTFDDKTILKCIQTRLSNG